MAEKFTDKDGHMWVVVPAPKYVDGKGGQDLLDAAAKLLEVGIGRLVLDLEGTRAVNSVGISRLIGILETAEEKNGVIIFCTPNSAIAKTFRIMGLANKATVCASVAEAKQSLLSG